MSSRNTGKKRASDLGLPYVYCWDCQITYETMQDLEDAYADWRGHSDDAEHILFCPNCKSRLPLPLRAWS